MKLDPVEAYDRIAPEFAKLSEVRRAYLRRIEQLVVAELPAQAQSLLDVGAGDGTRAARIAAAGQIHTTVLLEPSASMRQYWEAQQTGWAIRAEELEGRQESFDVITCLWNVLGHIFPAANRVKVLRQFCRLQSPGGLIFVDVSHRYNASHYGAFRTVARLLRDKISPDERNGDAVATWQVAGKRYSTDGHVFTHTEFSGLARAAGLGIRKWFAVDYATGEIRRSKFGGHLLYVLQRD